MIKPTLTEGEVAGKKPAKPPQKIDLAWPAPGWEVLFLALIITDLLAPFFLWPHWAGRFYSSWPDFFSSGLFHWLQSLALFLAWTVLGTKLWGRLWLVLTIGLHLILPPAVLDDRIASSLLGAFLGWWLVALPVALAAGRAPLKEPENQLKASAVSGSRQLWLITWLALLTNLVLIVLVFRPEILPGGPKPDGEAQAAALGVILSTAAFLVILSTLLLAGKNSLPGTALVYLAALISIGGLLWLSSGETRPSAEELMDGLTAIQLTLLPILAGLTVAAALARLALKGRRLEIKERTGPARPGWLWALGLLPLAGLGLAALPLWAGHLNRSYLEAPPASEPYTPLQAGPLTLPLPTSLKVTGWATFIDWAEDEAASPPPPDFWREAHKMILIEDLYERPDQAEREYEQARQRRWGQAPAGYPETEEDLSDGYSYPSHLLIRYHPPRGEQAQDSLTMRLTFFQRRPEGYFRLIEAKNFDPQKLAPEKREGFQAEMKKIFLKRVGQVLEAYDWGQRNPLPAGGAVFYTRFSRFDRHRLPAGLEAKFELSKAGDWAPERRRRGESIDFRIRSARPGFGLPRSSQPEAGIKDGASAPGRLPGRHQLGSLLGLIESERTRAAFGRIGRESIYIETGVQANSPAYINTAWTSLAEELELEMRSGRRTVQADLPALAGFWAAVLAGRPEQPGNRP